MMQHGPPNPGRSASTPVAKPLPLDGTDADFDFMMNDLYSTSSSSKKQTPDARREEQKYDPEPSAEQRRRRIEEDAEEDEKYEQLRRRAARGALKAPLASEQNRDTATHMATAAASAIPALGPYAGAIGAAVAVATVGYQKMTVMKEENKRLREENNEKLRGVFGSLIDKLISANLIGMMKNYFNKSQICYNASLFYNTGVVSNLLLSLDEEDSQEVSSYYNTMRTQIMTEHATELAAYTVRPPITGVWKHVENVKNFMEWQHMFIIGLSWLLYGVLCYQLNAWSTIKTAFEKLTDDSDASIRTNIYKWFTTYFGDPASIFSALFESQGAAKMGWFGRRWDDVKSIFSRSVGDLLTHNLTVLFGILAAGWASGFFQFIFDFFDTARELLSPSFMIRWIYTTLTCFHAGLIYNRNFTYKDIILKGFFEMPALKYSTKKYNFKTKKSRKATRKSPKAAKKSPKAAKKSRKATRKSPKAAHKSPKAAHKSPKAAKKSPKAGHKSPKAGHKSPKAGHKSPKAGHKSPKAAKKSPRKAHKSPKAAKKTH
jgi:hypothetical protein